MRFLPVALATAVPTAVSAFAVAGPLPASQLQPEVSSIRAFAGRGGHAVYLHRTTVRPRQPRGSRELSATQQSSGEGAGNAGTEIHVEIKGGIRVRKCGVEIWGLAISVCCWAREQCRM